MYDFIHKHNTRKPEYHFSGVVLRHTEWLVFSYPPLSRFFFGLLGLVAQARRLKSLLPRFLECARFGLCENGRYPKKGFVELDFEYC